MAEEQSDSLLNNSANIDDELLELRNRKILINVRLRILNLVTKNRALLR